MTSNPNISSASPQEVDPMNYVYAILMGVVLFFISALFLDNFDSYQPYAYIPILYLGGTIIWGDILKKPWVSCAILMLPVVLVSGDFLLRIGINGKFQLPLSSVFPVRIYFKAMFLPALIGTLIGSTIATIFKHPHQPKQQIPLTTGNRRPGISNENIFQNFKGFYITLSGLLLVVIALLGFSFEGKINARINLLFAFMNAGLTFIAFIAGIGLMFMGLFIAVKGNK